MLHCLKTPLLAAVILTAGLVHSQATPANKTALKKHYETFLAVELNRCTTCHLPSSLKNPETLQEFPHNPFGNRLRIISEELKATGKKTDLPVRLATIAMEDSDGDGTPNQPEILAGSNPGDPDSKPTPVQLANLGETERAFQSFLASYRWRPFEPVQQPTVPPIKNSGWVRTDLDAFISLEHEKRGLTPRPEASKEVLLRRVYLDMVGLNPTIAEQKEFLNDPSPDAYDKLVNRLLEDPRYGERWGRHWMDVWRYSDWAGWSGGNQIRDSKPHIWRWRDWIVESLNQDKSYDQMLQEMLAADELAPTDTNALRATGFLVRNYKMLSREQWLEDTVKHTSQAFLGVTIGCAKCHDHMTDPITQAEYYQLRAVFEPHQVRTDRVPGELDRLKNGLVRTYDIQTIPPTYFFNRGDERKPDTNRVMKPGVPKALAWDDSAFQMQPVSLPAPAAKPDRRGFVVKDVLRASEERLKSAENALLDCGRNPNCTPNSLKEKQFAFALAENRHEALLASLRAEELEENGARESEAWNENARLIATLQRKAALIEAKLKHHQTSIARAEAEAKLAQAGLPDSKVKPEQARKELESAIKNVAEAEKGLSEAQKRFAEASARDFTPRDQETYPQTSSGRRLAFAKWVTDPKNPLTARVAMNHIWLRHFGRGIVTTPENFGANGNPPTHPQLLDWLAAEFMKRGWSMKEMHRLILTSSTYRMASTPDLKNAAADEDNVFLWRMNSRRIDAELVRDNLLHVAGSLDTTMGGPDIDHQLGLKSKRRSIYLRIAAEKEVEFLKIFDGPAVTECYQRHSSVLPQQALAMVNSELALAQAKALSASLAGKPENDFVSELYQRVLAREPREEERNLCREFLASGKDKPERLRENLALVLLNHNDFVTVR